MSGNRLEQFLSSLDRESIFRKKELSLHRSLLSNADESQKAVLCRSGVLLLYAHWEGFVKKAAKDYLNMFVGLNISAVPTHLRRAALFHRLHKEQCNTLNFRLSKTAYDYISDESSIILSGIDDIVSTQSNLNYEQLEKIWTLIESDNSDFSVRFSTKRVFINHVLVHTRHGIAHGENLPISEDEFNDLYDTTVLLIENFKEAVIKSARSHHS